MEPLSRVLEQLSRYIHTLQRGVNGSILWCIEQMLKLRESGAVETGNASETCLILVSTCFCGSLRI